MKSILFSILLLSVLGGCAQKGFDQGSYDRQNKAAEKSLESL